MRTFAFRGVAARRPLVLLACTLAALLPADAAAAQPAPPSASAPTALAGAVQRTLPGATPAQPNAAATLPQCLTFGAQSERAVTLEGEMLAVPGTARMEIRIALLQRLPGEAQYRMLTAPGLSAWRSSSAGVKQYTSIQHVNNLLGPASYRGSVRFRWLNARGHQIKAAELRTPRCEQPPLLTGALLHEGTAPAPTDG
jgi:hypothetical protein